MKAKKKAKHPVMRSDRVPAMLTPGEAVLNKSAAKKLGKKKINKLNQDGLKDLPPEAFQPAQGALSGYAGGGMVDEPGTETFRPKKFGNTYGAVGSVTRGALPGSQGKPSTNTAAGIAGFNRSRGAQSNWESDQAPLMTTNPGAGLRTHADGYAKGGMVPDYSVREIPTRQLQPIGPPTYPVQEIPTQALQTPAPPPVYPAQAIPTQEISGIHPFRAQAEHITIPDVKPPTYPVQELPITEQITARSPTLLRQAAYRFPGAVNGALGAAKIAGGPVGALAQGLTYSSDVNAGEPPVVPGKTPTAPGFSWPQGYALGVDEVKRPDFARLPFPSINQNSESPLQPMAQQNGSLSLDSQGRATHTGFTPPDVRGALGLPERMQTQEQRIASDFADTGALHPQPLPIQAKPPALPVQPAKPVQQPTALPPIDNTSRLNSVGPGEGYMTGPGGTHFEIKGDQVKKFGANGAETPMRGALSFMPDDQTAATAEKQTAHDLGMQRLRAGLPYDATEAKAIQEQQAREGERNRLYGIATLPVNLHQDFGGLATDKQRRHVAGALLAQIGEQDQLAAKGRYEGALAGQKAQQDYQLAMDKADREGQWGMRKEGANPKRAEEAQHALLMLKAAQGGPEGEQAKQILSSLNAIEHPDEIRTVAQYDANGFPLNPNMVWSRTGQPVLEGQSANQPAQAAPKVGEVYDGHRYKGGDPKQQSSWEKVAA